MAACLSFEHASAARAAGVIAHEYPGPLTKIAVYALAGLVDYRGFARASISLGRVH
jgi:hypothetical protein